MVLWYARHPAGANVQSVGRGSALFINLPALAPGVRSVSGSEPALPRLSRRSRPILLARRKHLPQRLQATLFLSPSWPWLTSSPGLARAARSCSKSKLASGHTWIGVPLVERILLPTRRMKQTPFWKLSCWKHWISWNPCFKEARCYRLHQGPTTPMLATRRCYSLIQD